MGLWSGHETGTMIGSSWFADQEWDRLRSHAVAYLQIDQPACAGTTRWVTGSNVEMRNFHQEIERQELGGRTTTWSRAAKNGDSSFFGMGIPMLQGQGTFTEAELEATALANFGWWHHSIDNTIDKLDWDYMSDHLRIYAGWLWELCTAMILPYEFAPVGEQFVQRLDTLRVSGGSIGLAGTSEAAAEFHRAARTLDEAAHSWRAKYAAGERNDAPAALLNGSTGAFPARWSHLRAHRREPTVTIPTGSRRKARCFPRCSKRLTWMACHRVHNDGCLRRSSFANATG